MESVGNRCSAAPGFRFFDGTGSWSEAHLPRTFKVSNDPQFAEKLEAVIRLYRD
jgi:hypothetical protein